MSVQARLARAIREVSLPREPRLICGLDAAFSPDGQHCIAGAVVWNAETGAIVEQHVAWRRSRFPYIPGLLSFREAPALIAVLRRLSTIPDVLVCDGQGRAHPRRFGIACHVGLLSGLPAIGCAKTRLVGTHAEPGLAAGAVSPLWVGDEQVGMVLRTKRDRKPIFVSVGHQVALSQAVGWVLSWTRSHRLPEPTRLADRLVARERAGKVRR